MSSAMSMPIMQASSAAWPLGPPGWVGKKNRPKLRAMQVPWAISRVPYFAAMAGTLRVVWQRMGQAVQPLPRTVCFQACSPRK